MAPDARLIFFRFAYLWNFLRVSIATQHVQQCWWSCSTILVPSIVLSIYVIFAQWSQCVVPSIIFSLGLPSLRFQSIIPEDYRCSVFSSLIMQSQKLVCHYLILLTSHSIEYAFKDNLFFISLLSMQNRLKFSTLLLINISIYLCFKIVRASHFYIKMDFSMQKLLNFLFEWNMLAHLRLFSMSGSSFLLAVWIISNVAFDVVYDQSSNICRLVFLFFRFISSIKILQSGASLRTSMVTTVFIFLLFIQVLFFLL